MFGSFNKLVWPWASFTLLDQASHLHSLALARKNWLAQAPRCSSKMSQQAILPYPCLVRLHSTGKATKLALKCLRGMYMLTKKRLDFITLDHKYVVSTWTNDEYKIDDHNKIILLNLHSYYIDIDRSSTLRRDNTG